MKIKKKTQKSFILHVKIINFNKKYMHYDIKLTQKIA